MRTASGPSSAAPVRGVAPTRVLLLLLLLAVALVGTGSFAAAPAAAATRLPALAAVAPVLPAPEAPTGPTGRRAPTAPADPATTGVPAPPAPPAVPEPPAPGVRIDLGGTGESPMNNPLVLVLLLGVMSLIPAALIMMTAFTRIVIVLGFVRTALGTAGIPPNQVIVGLALFLSLFVMSPTLAQANDEAVQPFMRGDISQEVAVERGIEPFREFMLAQVRDEDLALFVKLAGDERPEEPSQVATSTLVPAFVVSELRTAFLIGFVIFIPFIVIDLIVSAALSAMGMVMLPPVLISLPFKLLLFVAADGWSLVVESLVESFRA